MKRSTLHIVTLLAAAMLLSLAAKASARENTCFFKATGTDVFVQVYDLDRSGETRHRIWQGRLNEGEQVRISTSEGLLQYYYSARPDEDQPMKGEIDRMCANNRTIGVP